MTNKPCAVPKCKTGNKSFKEKRSVFRVPKNIEKFRKWQAAIPGVVLKQSQYVCEKHFEEKYVLRKWTKRDSSGLMICESQYAHPRLDDSAVPTIFNGNDEIQEAVDSDHKFAAGPKDNMLHANVRIKDPPSLDLVKSRITHADTFPAIKIVDVVSIPQDGKIIDSVSEATEQKIVVSSLMINDYVGETTEDMQCEQEISLAPSNRWGVMKLVIQGEQRTIFSHFVLKVENGVKVPVIEKTVMLNTDNTLCYRVYERTVDPQSCNLIPTLKHPTQLTETLKRFKNMNVCNGLGAINVDHLTVYSAFKDGTDRWRDNNCAMISKRKRCDHCARMRQRIMQREARSNKNQVPRRIRQVTNPLDQKKLTALRKKLAHERRAKNKAKQQVQSLI